MHKLIFCLSTLILFSSSLKAQTPTQMEFKQRIIEALKTGTVESLYFKKGTDVADLKGTIDYIQKDCANAKQIQFNPLKPGQKFSYALNGYQYSPNLKPMGMVQIKDCGTQLPYGGHDGKLFIPATIKKLVNKNAGPDKLLYMYVSSFGEGVKAWCDVLYSNGKIERETFEYASISVRAQEIKACEVVNTKKTGTVGLKLKTSDMEKQGEMLKPVNTKIIFEKKITAPEFTIRFNSK